MSSAFSAPPRDLTKIFGHEGISYASTDHGYHTMLNTRVDATVGRGANDLRELNMTALAPYFASPRLKSKPLSKDNRSEPLLQVSDGLSLALFQRDPGATVHDHLVEQPSW
mgnify:CR=1 FL=1